MADKEDKFEEFIKETEESLDAFENDLAGFPKWAPIEIPKYLSMNVSELAKKSPDELSEAVFMLNQYGLNVQRLINRLRAWERWCNARLDQLEAHYIHDVPDRFGYNEKSKIARQSPPPCRKVNEYLKKVRMQIDRLYGMPDQIKIMADSIKDMKFIALKRERDAERSE